ncbi:hypothetical protein H6P81_007351 [Aristolochia fimbriata]|uniref:Uncharacterized protein n=1 Tax=Aristolochia fimbriata TaxID=158543 RepID=A0AAV7F037_ARIFI|nr:hypothetical protein H6P81_007351 [Aristolochia fimbriata]
MAPWHPKRREQIGLHFTFAVLCTPRYSDLEGPTDERRNEDYQTWPACKLATEPGQGQLCRLFLYDVGRKTLTLYRTPCAQFRGSLHLAVKLGSSGFENRNSNVSLNAPSNNSSPNPSIFSAKCEARRNKHHHHPEISALKNPTGRGNSIPCSSIF